MAGAETAPRIEKELPHSTFVAQHDALLGQIDGYRALGQNEDASEIEFHLAELATANPGRMRAHTGNVLPWHVFRGKLFIAEQALAEKPMTAPEAASLHALIGEVALSNPGHFNRYQAMKVAAVAAAKAAVKAAMQE